MGGGKQRQVGQQDKQSMLGQWAGWSTVASSGGANPRTHRAVFSSAQAEEAAEEAAATRVLLLAVLPQKPPVPFLLCDLPVSLYFI